MSDWKTATFSSDPLSDLEPDLMGKTCWVNMNTVRRIMVNARGTYLEADKATMGPYVEKPEHFMSAEWR